MLAEYRDRGILLDRRRFIVGAAGFAASAWPVRLWAAEAPHSFQQGDFEVTILSDGHLVLPAELLAPDTPEEERQAVLTQAGLTGENVTPATNPVLIRAGSDQNRWCRRVSRVRPPRSSKVTVTSVSGSLVPSAYSVL